MGSITLSTRGLELALEEMPEETLVRCSGKITARSSEIFLSEVQGRVIPDSRARGVAVTNRIVLDLSQVTHIDSSGLGALLGLWKAAQNRSCAVEIVNVRRRAECGLTKLDRAFKRIKALLSGA